MFMPLKTTKLLVTILVLLSTLILIHPVEAASKSKVKGTLYALDTVKNTFTLKKGGALTIVPLTTSSAITRNGNTVGLNGLVLGDKITASFSGSLYPKKVKAKGPSVMTVTGGVQNISTKSGTLQVNGKVIGTKTGTMIVRNGLVASLKSITLSDSVTVHTDTSGDAEDVQGEGPEEGEVEGTITGVDIGASTVTVTPSGGSPITVNVTAETEIEAGEDNEGATINDLLVGMFVEVKFDPVTLNAFRIEDEGDQDDEGEIEGTVTAVGAGTITILDGDGNS